MNGQNIPAALLPPPTQAIIISGNRPSRANICSLVSRPIIETTILRTPGLLYQENPDQTISNVYNIKIVNKTHETLPLEFRLISTSGKIKMAGGKMEIKDQAMFESTFILYLHRDQISSDRMEVEFGIYSNNEIIETYKASFVGP